MTHPLPITLTLPGTFARRLGRSDACRGAATTRTEGWLYQAYRDGERVRRGTGYTLLLRLHEAYAAEVVDLIEQVFETWLKEGPVTRYTRISIRQYLQRARDQITYPGQRRERAHR